MINSASKNENIRKKKPLFIRNIKIGSKVYDENHFSCSILMRFGYNFRPREKDVKFFFDERYIWWSLEN